MGARSSLVNESWSLGLPVGLYVGRSKKKKKKKAVLPISVPDSDGPF